MPPPFGRAQRDGRAPKPAHQPSSGPPADRSAPPGEGPAVRGDIPDAFADAAWGWHHALLGLLVGFGPLVLLSLLALTPAGDARRGAEASEATAIALILNSLVMYTWQIGAAWFFSLRLADNRLSEWGFRMPTKAYFWSIPTALFSVYAFSIVHNLIVQPEPQAILSRFPRTAIGIALFALLAVVIAPIFEELFFRGFLFRGLAASWGWIAGAVVSAAAFSVVHLQVSVMVPLFVLGFALAWVYKRTGSLWTCISLHALFNGISVLAWALTG